MGLLRSVRESTTVSRPAPIIRLHLRLSRLLSDLLEIFFGRFSDEKSAAHSQRGNMHLGLFRVSSVSVGHNIAPKYLIRKVLYKLSVLKHISEILHTLRLSMWTRSMDWPTPP